MIVVSRIVLALLGVLGAVYAGRTFDLVDHFDSSSYAYTAFGIIVFLAFAVGWMVGGLVGEGAGARVQEGRASGAGPQCGRAHRGRDRPAGRPAGVGAAVSARARAALHRQLGAAADGAGAELPVRVHGRQEAPRHPAPGRRSLAGRRRRRARARSSVSTLVDTSAIIDGRIADIVRTGFLGGELVVPEFVLQGAAAGGRLGRSAEAGARPPRAAGGAGPAHRRGRWPPPTSTSRRWPTSTPSC